MIYILEGKNVYNNQFAYKGFKYPSNWAAGMSQSDIDEMGIIVLTVVYPILGENEGYDDIYDDDYTNRTRTYRVIDVTPSAEQVKSSKLDALYQEQLKLIPLFLLDDEDAKINMAILQDKINDLING